MQIQVEMIKSARYTKISGIMLLLLLINGCATILTGTKQKVGFDSSPEGAEIYINGQFKGNTPLRISLKSSKSYSVEFRKEGYESHLVRIDKTIGAGWIVLDVLSGFWPVLFDAATGAWYSLDQEHVNSVLKKQE